jgi:hypothetical protein
MSCGSEEQHISKLSSMHRASQFTPPPSYVHNLIFAGVLKLRGLKTNANVEVKMQRPIVRIDTPLR